MMNKNKLKMMSDMTKLAMYQHTWLKVFVAWNYIKRFVIITFDVVRNKLKDFANV